MLLLICFSFALYKIFLWNGLTEVARNFFAKCLWQSIDFLLEGIWATVAAPGGCEGENAPIKCCLTPPICPSPHLSVKSRKNGHFPVQWSYHTPLKWSKPRTFWGSCPPWKMSWSPFAPPPQKNDAGAATDGQSHFQNKPMPNCTTCLKSNIVCWKWLIQWGNHAYTTFIKWSRKLYCVISKY